MPTQKPGSNLSIIVPMYNVEDYLEDCLRSLLKQGIEKEIILVDDGSTDKTSIIAQYYADNFIEIVLIHQENAGQSAARNRGLEIATGEYVFFCDSDDCIDEDSLPALYNLCREHNLDFLKTGWKTRKNGYIDINLPKEGVVPCNHVMTAKDFFKSTIYSWYNVIPGNGLFRRLFLIENSIKFQEGIQFEDNLYHLIVSTKDLSAKVMFTASTFYTVNISENSTTTSKPKPKKVYDQLENIRLMHQYVEEVLLDKEIANLAKVAISSLVFTMTNYYYRVDKKYRRVLNAAIPESVLKDAILHSQSKFQKYKLIAFKYSRPLLDLYEWFHMRSNR